MTEARHKVWAVLAAALAALLVFPHSALAAPNRVTSYDVRSISVSDGTRGILVGAELAPTVQLPAEVRLSVPKGAKVDWVGEILGGDPSKDPTAKYRTESGGSDFDVLVVTLTKVRRGQAEASFPAPVAGSDGTRLGISWQAPEPADTAQLAVEVPAGAKVSSSTAGATASQAGGTTFYVKQFTSLKKGTRLDLSLLYTGGAAPASPQQTPQPTPQQTPQNNAPGAAPSSPFVVVIVLAMILGGTFWALDRVQRRPQSPPAGDAASAGSRGKH